MTENLEVHLWGQRAGTLAAYTEHHKRKACFYMDREFLRTGYEIAPLRAPLSGISAMKGLPIYAEMDKRFCGLPSFIADSLPDSWGNRVFSAWAKSRGLSSRQISVLDRLSFIGRRGMGALEFEPHVDRNGDAAFRVDLNALYGLTHDILAGRDSACVPDTAYDMILRVGSSAAGKHPKALLNINPETRDCWSGQAPPPAPEYIPCLVKLDEHSSVPYTAIEYSYYLMAQHAGLGMEESVLIEDEGGRHFVTKRFDRNGGEKVHVQTLCAMNPSADCYEDLFRTATSLGVPHSESKQLFLSMALNVITGNVDDHNRNYSFLMRKDGVWHVSPIYDYTFTVDPSSPSYVNVHSMSVNGKNRDVSAKDMLEVASEYNIKDAPSLIGKAISAAREYSSFAETAGVSKEWREFIEGEIEHRLQSLESSRTIRRGR